MPISLDNLNNIPQEELQQMLISKYENKLLRSIRVDYDWFRNLALTHRATCFDFRYVRCRFNYDRLFVYKDMI